MIPNKPVKTNSLQAWILAARPKTLSGAAVPVMVALSAAWTDLSLGLASDSSGFKWLPALLCLLFAFLMQINANLVNDYFDCIKGVDRENRLGPERACAQGWVTLPAMKRAINGVTLLCGIVGLPLVYWGGWSMVLVGLCCLVFCFLYTTWLSRIALGDVLVLLFFGVVPVSATYYIQTHQVTTPLVCLSIACGLVTDCLLIVNNYRDRETDREVGKSTLVTIIGPKVTEWLYLLLGLLGIILTVPALGNMAPGLVLYLCLHLSAWYKMKSIGKGRALNTVLGQTAFNILCFGLSVSILLLLSLTALH